MIHVRFRAALQALVLLLLIAACAATTSRSQDGTTAARTSRLATGSTVPTMVHQAAQPLSGAIHDYDPLLTLIGDARFVLLGEATHGTHEFYRERARITRRLIEEKGFTAIAIEGDWTDAERVNRYVRAISDDMSAEQALADFTRFPQWMWGNTDVRDFVQWLQAYNAALPMSVPRVGFYGLDLYSLFRSADAAVYSLEQVDPQAAYRARQRYQCFAPFRDDPLAYGRSVASGHVASCESAAVQQLNELHELQQLQQWNATLTPPLAPTHDDILFSALQNARVVKNAEAFYRTLHTGEDSTWNLRDRHMADTLDELFAAMDVPGRPAKIVVWAHNTHVGDARATQLGESGEWNVGQLMRERYEDHAVLVGFTTYTGTVMAASAWDAPGEQKQVRAALAESYAGHFHDVGIGDFLLLLRGRGNLTAALGEPRLERAIGVVYLPQTERWSHYFEARLSQQFDAVIHWDVTRAVEPLKP